MLEGRNERCGRQKSISNGITEQTRYFLSNQIIEIMRVFDLYNLNQALSRMKVGSINVKLEGQRT